MKKFKVRFMLKPYFLIPVILITLVALAFIFWYLMPSKRLSVVLVDKTVPATAADSYSYLDDVSNDYRKHIGLYWIMNQMKIKNPLTNKAYNYKSDYFGPKLNENREIVSCDSISSLSYIPDILYLSDTYGVEIYDDHGITADEMNAISLCHTSGSIIIGEQDILTTATSDKVKNQLENLFGISSTGWVGRYIFDLQDLTDVPYWAPDMWRAKYGQEWNCSGPGILLVSASGDILVLEEKTDFESKNLFKISIEKEYQKEFGKHSVNFYNWFELIEADSNTEVIATFSFNVNSTGAQELAAVSDTTTFAAVTRKKTEDTQGAYYFAGDFNDYPTKLQISNFIFADSFFRLIAFDRDGDVTNFYWNFYEPMVRKILKDALKNPITKEQDSNQQISKIDKNKFMVLQNNEWKELDIKGFNINGEQPGGQKYKYSRDHSYYSTLLNSLANMGSNCVRAYDLLPPEFYRALYEYNKSATSPIYLIQSIMSPSDIEPANTIGNLESINNKIASTIMAVNGKAIAGNTDSQNSNISYLYNVGQYVIAYIIDLGIDSNTSDIIMQSENRGYTYKGQYISSSRNAIEAISAQVCDFTLQYLNDNYGYMTPVSVCFDAQRLEGAFWTIDNNISLTYNISKLEVSPQAEQMYFSSYSLNAHDNILLDNQAAFSEFTDASGSFAYGGYIQQVKQLCNGPVLIDRAGLSTNSNLFEMQTDINNLSEKSQGEGIVRMHKAALQAGYMGMLIADLNDNWCGLSPNAQNFTVPILDNGLWHNTTDRAQTSGVVAVESITPDQVSMELNDNSIMKQMQLSYNETYLYMTILLESDIDYDTNEMIVGIDTYQRNNGEYYYDKNYFANSLSGMEYIIKFESKNFAALYVSDSYNRNEQKYTSTESYDAEYDLVSVLNYGNFTTSNTHFYQAGVTIRLRIPWAMLNFTDPARGLVINGYNDGTISTTSTDGIIFSLLVGDKKTMDTAYIFPIDKQAAGYKSLKLSEWSAQDIEYIIRDKESCSIIKRYFSTIN